MYVTTILGLFLIISWLVVFSIIAHRKLEYGILAILLLLPVYHFRLKIGWVPTTVLELMIYIVAGESLRQVFRDRPLTPLYERIINLAYSFLGGIEKRRSMFWALLLWVGLLTSVAISTDLSSSMGILKAWFFDPMLFVGIVYWYFRKLDKDKRGQLLDNVINAIALSGLITSIIALAYYFTGNTTFDGRLASFYDSPNQLAMFLELTFLTALFVSPRGYVAKKHIRIAFALIIGIVILLTQSTGALLGVLGALFVLIIIKTMVNKKYVIIKTILFASMAIAVLLPALSLSPTTSLRIDKFFGEHSSVTSRTQIWRSAITIGVDHPVLGIGPGTFQGHYLEYQKGFSPYLEWAAPHPHNLFLTTWLYAGFLGLVAILGILVVMVNRVSSNSNDNPRLKLLILLVIMSSLIHGSVDTVFWSNELSVITTLLLTMGYSQRN